jgi:phage terminase large subunit-like protein
MMGQPFVPLEFQKKIIREAFGWKRENGKNKYSVVYVEIPRGNGKSTFGQSIGLYKMAGAGILSSHVYCVASSRDQADGAIFAPVKNMVEQNDELNKELTPYFNSVRDYTTKSFFKLLSSDWRGSHSLIPVAVIFDELHLQDNARLWDGFKTGMKKRTDVTPQIWVFTTAGATGTWPETIHDYAVGVRDGIIDDDSWSVHIWSADKEDDPFDPKVWEKVNPGWEFINQDEFRKDAKFAKNTPSYLNTFRQYHLNQWVGSVESWLPKHEWMANKEEINLDDCVGLPAYMGMDLSSTRDVTALCLLFAKDGILMSFFWFWVPKKTVQMRSYRGIPYRIWSEGGYMEETSGDAVDYRAIKDKILELNNRFDIKMIRYDPKFAGETVIDLKEKGMEIEPLAQSSNNITPAIQTTEVYVIEKKLKHQGNPVMTWMMENTNVKRSHSGDLRLVKKVEENRIDGPLALVHAISAYTDLHNVVVSDTLTKGIQFIG